MQPRDIALAALVATIWGFAFVATKIGLESFSPAQLTALRFLIACVPALFLPRPRLPWRVLVLIGLTLFTGQFLLLFFAFKNGLPAGVASVVQQTQVFFTVGLAAGFLKETVTIRQCIGMAIALVGMLFIFGTIDENLAAAGLCLGLASALSWATGNILLKSHPGMTMLPLMVWLSLVPPLPALAVAAFAGDDIFLVPEVLKASWSSLAAVLYLGAVATLAAYAAWGSLLTRYSAAQVTPFALIVPCAGVFGSWLMLGETFGAGRYAGMAALLIGVGVAAFPGRKALTGVKTNG